MIVLKRRLIFWLIRAYIKKWGKVIVLYFFLGLAIFFIFLLAITYFIPKLPIVKKEIIGNVGSYRIETVPENILQKISQGLTIVDDDGVVKPGLASSWEIKDSGKTYIFHLRPHLSFSNGIPLTSHELNLSFSDVSIQTPNNDTIIFHIKDPYAPFLVSVSHPILRKGFIGIGEYKLTDIKLNGDFVQTLTLQSIKNASNIKTYQFYPTEDALKISYSLGEISRMEDVNNLNFKNTTFTKYPNTQIQRITNYTTLVTIFYNTQEKDLSDKRLRDALAYVLPNSFSEGERAHSPLAPVSWAYQEDTQHVQDFTHAKLLMQAAGYDTTKSTTLNLTISTLPKYKALADSIAIVWKQIGITAKIAVVDTIPTNFQVYLGDFRVSKDPDQYTLWHSAQVNDITNYKNLRIDKLLEDGRKTIEQDKRIKLYADFQKYLMDDQPASFLYFPYSYTVVRK